MNNENLEIDNNLEQMRSQYALLKKQLDSQEIINQKLIRESIRRDLRIVNQKKWLSIATGLIAISMIPQLCLRLGLRTPFIIVSVVWICAMLIGNLVRNRDISGYHLSGESTQKFLHEIKKRMKLQYRWFRINFTIMFLWIGYFIGECVHAGLSKDIMIPMIIGIGAGAIIGIIVGINMHNRIIHIYEGIILELENPEASHSIMQ